eukprot:4730689-Pleurochrysis_carterae.AAC.2
MGKACDRAVPFALARKLSATQRKGLEAGSVPESLEVNSDAKGFRLERRTRGMGARAAFGRARACACGCGGVWACTLATIIYRCACARACGRVSA